MKHIIEKYEEPIYESRLWHFYFDGLRVGVLDIETTGLNPSRNKFVLGCLYDVAKKELHQVLAESRAEEPAALAEYLKLIDDVDLVVTYNGKHFDIPFIQKRADVSSAAWNYFLHEVNGGAKTEEKDKLQSHISYMPYNLDIYLMLNGHSPIKKLVPNMKQKTIENFMGLWSTRSDEISGAESVELYNHYEATGDKAAEEKILLHNNDDVRQLTKLTKTVIKSDFHKAMFNLGFPVRFGSMMLTVTKIRLQRECLQVCGVQNRKRDGSIVCVDYMGFNLDDYPVESRLSRKDATFEFRIPIIRNSGIAVVDLQAAGIDEKQFGAYPSCGSGFLVIEDKEGLKHMEINHFVKAFITDFIERAL